MDQIDMVVIGLACLAMGYFIAEIKNRAPAAVRLKEAPAGPKARAQAWLYLQHNALEAGRVDDAKRYSRLAARALK